MGRPRALRDPCRDDNERQGDSLRSGVTGEKALSSKLIG
jgi:hypothetical protein